MANQHLHLFRVRGGGEFPFDMLRYDACRPVRESEARSMARSYADDVSPGLRVVTLGHTGDRSWTPTDRRWASFGWKVVAVHGERNGWRLTPEANRSLGDPKLRRSLTYGWQS